MAIIDVLKFDGPPKTLVWKWRPKNSTNRGEELRLGSQLVVNHSQTAIFIKGGKILDEFSPGTYTLSTQNLPLISDLIGLVFGGQSPFKAELFFLNAAVSLDIKFGLIPFNVIEQTFKVPIPVTSRGSFGVRVVNGHKFLNQLVGTTPDFDSSKISQFFRGVIGEKVKSCIIRISSEKNISPLQFESITSDVTNLVASELSGILDHYGLELIHFVIEAIPVIDEDPRVKRIVEDSHRIMSSDLEERLRFNRRSENLETFKIERTFDTTQSAAEGLGKGNGDNGVLGAMIGMNMAASIGSSMNNLYNNATKDIQSNELSKTEVISLLKELGELRKVDIITELEFQEKKTELLKKL
jgi:membrane protease subunit (stomatin/prohibitin family)